MLYFYSGTDRRKARGAMNAEIERVAKKAGSEVLRITDTNAPDDLRTALGGPGIFGTMHVLVLEDVLANEEMRAEVLEAIPYMESSHEAVFWYEEKPDAAARRKIEKHAGKSLRYDMQKKEQDNSVFALTAALRRADKKALWVGYQRALLLSERAEAIHGVLFWGAKDMFLKSHSSADRSRAATLVADLAELPHAARRRGVELEYALERYILDVSRQ